MKKSYLHGLFIQITLFTTIIVLILTLFLYFSFRNIQLELLNSSNEKLMNHVFEHAMQVNAYVENFAVYTTNSPEATELMYENDIPMIEVLNNIEVLDASLSSTPFLVSAYIYNGETSTYYTIGPNPTIRQGSFYDREIEQLLAKPGFHAFTPLPRKMPYTEWDSQQLIHTYTYVYPKYSNNGSKIRSALILNVQVEWLFNTLLSYAESPSLNGNNMMIIDPAGQVIGHSDNDLFLQDLSDKPYVQSVMASGQPSGYFMAEVDGVPSVVTYASYEYPEWKMISVTPYSYVASAIQKVRTITLTITSIVLAIGLLATFLLARRLYSPIATLRKQVGALTGKTNPSLSDGKAGNELEYISQSLSFTHHKLESLEAFKKEHMFQINQIFLKKILSSETGATSGQEKQFKVFNVNVQPEEPLAAILLRLDRYHSFCAQYSETDRSLLKYALLNISNEVLRPYVASDAVDMGGDHVVVLVNVKGREESESGASGELDTLTQQIQQQYEQYSGLTISAAITEPISDIHQLSSMYKQALLISNYRMVYGHGCLIKQEETGQFVQEEMNADDSQIEELLNGVKTANWMIIVQHVNAIMSQLYKYQYSNMMFYLSLLTSSVFHTLNAIERNSSLDFGIDFITFHNKIQSLETLEEIKEEYLALFKQIIEKMQKQKNEKTELIVSNAMKYVEIHYRDNNLSPQVIANYINLTPAYLNKLFREHTAESLSNYITKVRMDKAKQLLLESDYNVDEIIDKVGWENKKYFYTVFKRNHGVTPSEYRLTAKVKTLG
ncbi:helix-turn-helix domain-containing protein [Paenibacillus sp. J5C_2022]|uniref:helix-turn-helix domain-containing protein n=1 Tax=Paenibacillus sp. J5C2022 TaxID=2977129 RepID=UPI0021D30081|nr:helix-turn-helix domain-containing protein [Paenibacillus sp. J5C2022]MCU6708897.1 helix-turn-helix domain-containing protein [Paenibacillus sp. J5C2022]